jgi:trans-aconitate 2-methyltransferase
LTGAVLWDASSYDQQPLPHKGWGAKVLARTRLTAGESIVDAGCGTGRDAELAVALAATLADDAGVEPGAVTLLDADPSMVASARQRFAAAPERVRPRIEQVDLLEKWPVTAPADVVMSVATFHWISDHRAVFSRAAQATASDGRLHIDCGGEGNVASLTSAAHNAGIPMPHWNFAGVDDTVSDLRASGWEPDDVWLTADPLVFREPAAFRDFLRTVVLHDATESQLDAVVSACPDLTVDYVRLNVDAHRQS